VSVRYDYREGGSGFGAADGVAVRPAPRFHRPSLPVTPAPGASDAPPRPWEPVRLARTPGRARFPKSKFLSTQPLLLSRSNGVPPDGVSCLIPRACFPPSPWKSRKIVVDYVSRGMEVGTPSRRHGSGWEDVPGHVDAPRREEWAESSGLFPQGGQHEEHKLLEASHRANTVRNPLVPHGGGSGRRRHRHGG
jgi:hypothetical protein